MTSNYSKVSDRSSSQEEVRDRNCTKKDNSLALIPVKEHGPPSNSIRSLIVQELLDQKTSLCEKPRNSAVHWAMRLPSRYAAASVFHSDSKQDGFDGDGQAIVPVRGFDSLGSSVTICDEEKEPPEELRSLQEKYSSVCRLFSYKELKHATTNFSPGSFPFLSLSLLSLLNNVNLVYYIMHDFHLNCSEFDWEGRQ